MPRETRVDRTRADRRADRRVRTWIEDWSWIDHEECVCDHLAGRSRSHSRLSLHSIWSVKKCCERTIAGPGATPEEVAARVVDLLSNKQEEDLVDCCGHTPLYSLVKTAAQSGKYVMEIAARHPWMVHHASNSGKTFMALVATSDSRLTDDEVRCLLSLEADDDAWRRTMKSIVFLVSRNGRRIFQERPNVVDGAVFEHGTRRDPDAVRDAILSTDFFDVMVRDHLLAMLEDVVNGRPVDARGWLCSDQNRSCRRSRSRSR